MNGVSPASKELRPTPAGVAAGVLAILAWSAWSATSSRIALFVCAGTVAALLLDLVWSQVATARVAPSIVANPEEAVVGDRVELTLHAEGPPQFVRATVATLTGTAEVGVDVPATGQLSGVAPAREVLSEVAVEILNPGLAGLLGCSRRQPVRLARVLAVGPRPVPAEEAFPELFRRWGEGHTRPAAAGDLVRGVRPYTPGDQRRHVHWRATARVGDLVVKEVEDIGVPHLAIALDLGRGGPAGERAAGRAAWYALEALWRGYSVTLVTRERSPGGSRTVAGPVLSSSDVNRRLAAAVGPEAPDLPEGDAVLSVTDRGDSWR